MMAMQAGMVYQHSIWTVGLLLIGFAVLGAVLIELLARGLLGTDLRHRHNDVGAAIFNIIGITYAVLLAFVAMLAWEGFTSAQAASHREAAALLDVGHVASALAEPGQTDVRAALLEYARAVIDQEWPAQAEGRFAEGGAPRLEALNRAAIAVATDTVAAPLGMKLLDAVGRLSDARQERLLAAATSIPPVTWIVLVVGGALTIAFASLLGAPNLWMHLAMSSCLAVSGAMVLLLIVALSEPFRGDFRVSTEPYEFAVAQILAAERAR